ncbi:MAG: glycosyltransferase family 1 protein [Blastocatellia bacterium]
MSHLMSPAPFSGSSISAKTDNKPDLICLSHLRWDFVYQRPQHLLSRCARERRVFLIEEPVFDADLPLLEMREREGVKIAIPHLPPGGDEGAANAMLRELTDDLMAQEQINEYVLWYYTPMALGFTRHLQPLAVIYDCMDELSAFKGAPPAMHEREQELFSLANHVFTGGQSLYEAKCRQHPHAHAFPSSVDVGHFAQARSIKTEPEDQRAIPHPRLGFFGVIDERMNLELLAHLADLRPGWHLVMIGPVVKIAPEDLPQRDNIHYLGGKSYAELPAYLAGWEVALLPFALNESTRFISPTKTPEYLAAGKPVISTSIRDVIRPYREIGLVRIADTAEQFVKAAEAAMAEDAQDRVRRSDAFLMQMSWNRTWAQMSALIDEAVAAQRSSSQATQPAAPRAVANGRIERAVASGD